PLLPRGLLLLAPNRGNSRATVEFTWRGLELIVGNYYVLTLLVFIAATACALLLTRRLKPERAQSAVSELRAYQEDAPASTRRHWGGPGSPIPKQASGTVGFQSVRIANGSCVMAGRHQSREPTLPGQPWYVWILLVPPPLAILF